MEILFFKKKNSSQGKALETRTSIYKRTEAAYALKMKTSRAIYSEVTQKFGFMAFNLRMFEDEKKARMGLIECVTHGLVTPYDVVYEKEGNFCFFIFRR